MHLNNLNAPVLNVCDLMCSVCAQKVGFNSVIDNGARYVRYQVVYLPICGPSNVVSIATAYGWTVRGSNPGGGEISHTCPDRP